MWRRQHIVLVCGTGFMSVTSRPQRSFYFWRFAVRCYSDKGWRCTAMRRSSYISSSMSRMTLAKKALDTPTACCLWLEIWQYVRGRFAEPDAKTDWKRLDFNFHSMWVTSQREEKCRIQRSCIRTAFVIIFKRSTPFATRSNSSLHQSFYGRSNRLPLVFRQPVIRGTARSTCWLSNYSCQASERGSELSANRLNGRTEF